MGSETKRPTAQDIENLRKRVDATWCRIFEVNPIRSRDGFLEYQRQWGADLRVLDYAAAGLQAEEEAERAARHAAQEARDDEMFANLKAGTAVAKLSEAMREEEEAERVTEQATPGTPVWREGNSRCLAYIGDPVPEAYVLCAHPSGWVRYPNNGGYTRLDDGPAGSLAASIRAATASWNAAHPDLPPVVVPEQFRESEEVPEVEAPEDAGDDGWIAWEGGECPVADGVSVEVTLRDGSECSADASRDASWRHLFGRADIVRYRIVAKPEQTPEERVAAMTDEEVEAEVTRRGVEDWWPFAGRMFRPRRGDLQAITVEGFCYPPTDGGVMLPFDDVEGDTTTPSGRMECTRRLLVHLLREEAS